MFSPNHLGPRLISRGRNRFYFASVRFTEFYYSRTLLLLLAKASTRVKTCSRNWNFPARGEKKRRRRELIRARTCIFLFPSIFNIYLDTSLGISQEKDEKEKKFAELVT